MGHMEAGTAGQAGVSDPAQSLLRTGGVGRGGLRPHAAKPRLLHQEGGNLSPKATQALGPSAQIHADQRPKPILSFAGNSKETTDRWTQRGSSCGSAGAEAQDLAWCGAHGRPRLTSEGSWGARGTCLSQEHCWSAGFSALHADGHTADVTFRRAMPQAHPCQDSWL